MTREFKGRVQYSKGWMEDFMKDTVIARIYADEVMLAMTRLKNQIANGEVCSIRSTIAHLRYDAPTAKKQQETVDSIVEGIDWLCQNNDPENIAKVEKQIAIIYHSLIDTEYMFNGEKLEELPEWQSQMP